jgi:hypothetical protein
VSLAIVSSTSRVEYRIYPPHRKVPPSRNSTRLFFFTVYNSVGSPHAFFVPGEGLFGNTNGFCTQKSIVPGPGTNYIDGHLIFAPARFGYPLFSYSKIVLLGPLTVAKKSKGARLPYCAQIFHMPAFHHTIPMALANGRR